MAIIQDPTHPTGVTSTLEGPDPDVVRARDRKANAAVQMRIAGASWDEIAEVIGYPSGRDALVATERALEKELRDLSKDSMRQMAGRRLERLLRGVWPKAINPEHPDQLPAIGKAREIIADHRKLFGLDAPTQVAIHSPAESEIAAWVSTVVNHGRPAIEEADIFDLDDDDVTEEVHDA